MWLTFAYPRPLKRAPENGQHFRSKIRLGRPLQRSTVTRAVYWKVFTGQMNPQPNGWVGPHPRAKVFMPAILVPHNAATLNLWNNGCIFYVCLAEACGGFKLAFKAVQTPWMPFNVFSSSSNVLSFFCEILNLTSRLFYITITTKLQTLFQFL